MVFRFLFDNELLQRIDLEDSVPDGRVTPESIQPEPLPDGPPPPTPSRRKPKR